LYIITLAVDTISVDHETCITSLFLDNQDRLT